MYDDKESPYRCPLCLTRPSLCTTEANTGLQTVGCMTMSCRAPVFTEPKDGLNAGTRQSKLLPLIEWDSWVSDYRKANPDWHREVICKGCLKYKKNENYSDYDPDCINCPEAEYKEEEN